jgi:hypothetical protein
MTDRGCTAVITITGAIMRITATIGIEPRAGACRRRLRAALVVVLTAAAFGGLMASDAGAETDYPWCVVAPGGYGAGFTSCGFVSLPQCLQTARGDGGLCMPNPRLARGPLPAGERGGRRAPQR